MLNEKMESALNDQIQAEMYSAYLYLSMSAWFTSLNQEGMANWMQGQAQEEMTHAMKFYRFIHERGGRVKLQAVEAPPAEWDSPLAAFEAAYAHEQKVTARIHALVDAAMADKDHATNAFLQWFVSEQVEEEASADAIVQKLKLIGDRPQGLFMLDRELGRRAFTPAAAEGEGGE